MLCKHCGDIVPDNALVCPQCGAEVVSSRRSAAGTASIRQGRPEPAPSERPYHSAPFEDEPAAEDAVVLRADA